MNIRDRWDEREKRLENDEPTADTYSDKKKVDVVTEEEEDDEPLFSGLFCVFCKDIAIHIFDGMSLCHECFNKEMADVIRNRNKK